ncbi:branched-chain amino acid ABC transporter permease [Desulfosoma caldarium]|uniref:Branched-chain amino acid transport system permease protein n=1 Tax=Desulfosoma caldarium TaxID=610254 RepID=A0A3N1UIB4_9BACT|nr:branched-chain amino acid ABC transporter permease [Desulfosoma caldarium]ROQ91005.1 branched-chain amino acid transport system permease protein [Desulfosoma caldarium]
MKKKPFVSSLIFWTVILGLAAWPAVTPHADLVCRVLTMAFLYAVMAMAWNVTALSGLISLGHAAYFGLGAYGAALMDHYGFAHIGWTLTAAALSAGVYGALCAAVFRSLRGATFALVTLAAVDIPKVIADNWESVTFGSLGLVGVAPLPVLRVAGLTLDFASNLLAQYYALLGVLLLGTWVHHKAMHSRWGWALRAIREDEQAAGVLGIPVQALRWSAMTLSAVITGLCGGLYAHLHGFVEPPLVFSAHLSAMPLVLSILGGRFRWYGPALAALFLYPLDQLVLHPVLPAGHAALYGLAIVAAVLFFPQGLGSWKK